jgi:hypothetical protein
MLKGLLRFCGKNRKKQATPPANRLIRNHSFQDHYLKTLSGALLFIKILNLIG